MCFVHSGLIFLSAPFVPSQHMLGCLHYCLLGSWQSKKHAHLARIIRRSSLIQFSIQLGPLGPVRYRGHAPRMDYLALLFKKRRTN